VGDNEVESTFKNNVVSDIFWIQITFVQFMLTLILFSYFTVLQVISKLSLSKEECRQDVVKEAFKVSTLEVKDKKKDEDKHVKIVQQIEEFNRLSKEKEY